METKTAIKERPILFSTPMVQAILAGNKTQTRRIIKPQPDNPHCFGVSPIWGFGVPNSDPEHFCIHAATNVGGKREDKWIPCPYGKSGDRLWVRETWSGVKQLGGTWVREKFHYKATEGENDLIKWKPSIHMPRAACRLLLEIVSVRVERLQDITEQDAIAEGIERISNDPDLFDAISGEDYAFKNYIDSDEDAQYLSAKNSFRTLWQSINGPESWCANPWVWVVEFKVAA